MESFSGKLAVVTGGGSGMGRELVRLLAAAGCSVAACDWRQAAVEQAAAGARAGAAVSTHACDVSDEAQVERFGDELLAAHARGHVDLVFCNAAIGGGPVRRVADTRRPRRQTDRCGGARQARSRLRLRRAVQRGTASAGPGSGRGLMRPGDHVGILVRNGGMRCQQRSG